MTNEKEAAEWWEERTRKLFHGVWGASPWNEERMTDAAIEVLRDIVAEAERRGERRAWSEAKEIVHEVMDCSDDTIGYYEDSIQKNIDTKLTSLKKV